MVSFGNKRGDNMTIKTDLIKGHICDIIRSELVDFEIDEEKIVNSKAIEILTEIQEILKISGDSDFDTVEKLVGVFEKYKLDTGGCHDF